MIAWPQALELAALLASDPARTARAVAEVCSSAAPFQNRGYPLSPLPLLLDEHEVAAVVPLLEAYVSALGRLVEAYRDHAEVRAWFGLDAMAEALVLADTRCGDLPLVCRLDTYLEQGTERVRLLENNADAPAGTLFTARVNRAVSEVVRRCGGGSCRRAPGGRAVPVGSTADGGHGSPQLDDELLLLEALRRRGVHAGAHDSGIVTVVQRDEAVSREVREMVAVFRTAGFDAEVADPRALEVRGGRACFGKRPGGFVWNKVNTVDWQRLAAEDPTLAQRWLAALDDTDFVHANPFGARFVAESKLSLALLRSARFAGLWSARERAAVEALLPDAWLLAGGTDGADGPAPVAEAARQPARFVVKDPYDIRGDGVRVGGATDAYAWADALAPPGWSPRLLQRYVTPSAYPVLVAGGATRAPAVVCMPTSLDAYVVEGAVAGFGAKAATGPKVNVYQGGQKLSVQVVPGAPPEHGSVPGPHEEG